MMSGSGNQPMQGGSFNHLEHWFNDALDLLGVLKLQVERTLSDDRSLVECIPLRKSLDQFANGFDAFVRVKRLKERYEDSEFYPVLEDIKTASGDQILDDKCQIEQNGKTFYTAAEALYSLLEMICRERTFLDEAVEEYDQERSECLESCSPDEWDEHWYRKILLHVSELSKHGLKDDFLNQLRKLFDQQKYGYLKWNSERSGGNGKGQISQNDMSIRHNPSSSLFDDLLTGFKEAKFQQQGYKISHVLTEYVSEDAIRRGWADQREKLEEWRSPIGLDTPKLKNPHGRCFHSAILLYQGENQVQDLKVLKRFAPVYDRLKRYLEIAGADLLEKLDLPSEISIQTDPVSRWLLYLHYTLKPDRTTWEIGAGLNAFGMFLSGDRIDDAGKFSFEKLSENSYSIIGDVPLSSIRAVRGIQQVETISGLQASSTKSLIQSQPLITSPGINDDQSENEYSDISEIKQVQKSEFSIDELCKKFAYSRDGLNPYILESGESVAERGKPSLTYSIDAAINIAQAIIDRKGNSKESSKKALDFIQNHSQKRN